MLVIGLMSGTSMDGVDAALIDTDGESHITCLGGVFLPYDHRFKALLKAAKEALLDRQDRTQLNSVAQQSTQLHAAAIEQLLTETGYSAKQIGLIGYHGQTIYHQPQAKTSLQIGDAAYLAQQFGITVINNFRHNDLQHGGQGAPLAPLYHQALMKQKKIDSLVMVNCGGIANVSIITGGQYADIIAGFDTGPGNKLIDKFVYQWTNGREIMDVDGQYGLNGQVDYALLKQLFNKAIIDINGTNYFAKKPPKSLDSNDILFIPEIAEIFLQKTSDNEANLRNLQNGCATLAAFTAQSIANCLIFFAENKSIAIPTYWVITGGGAKNRCLVNLLRKYLQQKNQCISLLTGDQAGLSKSNLEAEMMAWLAMRSLKGLAISIPQTTGVAEPLSGGQAHLPAQILHAEVSDLLKNNPAVITGYSKYAND